MNIVCEDYDYVLLFFPASKCQIEQPLLTLKNVATIFGLLMPSGKPHGKAMLWEIKLILSCFL